MEKKGDMGCAQIPSSYQQATPGDDTQRAEPLGLWLLGFYLHFNEGFALIRSTFRADMMRHAQRATLRAANKVDGRQGIMRATAIAAALGYLTFWLRGHCTTPFLLVTFQQCGQAGPTRIRIRLAIAVSFVQVLPTTRAETTTILPT